MSLKSAAKSLVLGRPGPRPRRVRVGLLKGLRFTIDTASKSQRLLGLDEAEVAAPLRKLAAACASACDIGANDGWYALYFASLPNVERVVACEPGPELIAETEANFALNDPALGAKLTCVTKFAGDRDDAQHATLATLTEGLPRPVLLKIDVEGGELAVLNSGLELLRSREARLVVETHGAELEAECLKLLRGLGYECEVVGTGWYRKLVPENRSLAHNRWLVAVPGAAAAA